MIRRVVLFGCSALVGVVIGTASSIQLSGLLPNSEDLGATIDVAGWTSNWTMGTDAADPYTKAWVARNALLALRREEAVYFRAETDNAGRRLTEGCEYTIVGADIPGSWWSVTVYDNDSYLPKNTDGALSIASENLETTNGWKIRLSSLAPNNNMAWISTRSAGEFDVTLRIYEPSAALINDPEKTLVPPRIERMGC